MKKRWTSSACSHLQVERLHRSVYSEGRKADHDGHNKFIQLGALHAIDVNRA
jgi:hypothetical protein